MRKTTVRLPHDGLTEAQKRRMNGPMHEYKMNEPMSIQEFKAMPDDLQVEYVRGLVSRFGVGVSTVGVELFGKSRPWLGDRMKRRGVTFQRNGHLTMKQRYEWEKWLNGVKEPVKETEHDETAPKMVLESASVRFLGEVTPNAIMKALAKVSVPDGRCEVCISICRLPEGV